MHPNLFVELKGNTTFLLELIEHPKNLHAIHLQTTAKKFRVTLENDLQKLYFEKERPLGAICS
jgi:hypothetical protein